MVKLLDIKVDKADIYKDIEMITAYFGPNTVDEEGNTLYDSVVVTKYQYERLDKFWTETCGLIAEPIKQFLVYLNSDAETLAMGLNMPSNYIVSFDAPIKQAVYEYVKNSILAKWYGIVYKSEAEKHSAIAAANMVELRNKLFARRAPSRVNPK